MIDIKTIIKESLLNEVGDASAQPYAWRRTENHKNMVIYRFRTKGGSKLNIDVSFHKLDALNIVNFINREDSLSIEDKRFYYQNPYFYWETEFGDDEHATISTTKHKTSKVEVFRIMATLSNIVKDMMDRKKVRGFVFRPASDSRGNMFIRYFKEQIPESKVLRLDDGGTFVTVNHKIKYKPERGEKAVDWEKLANDYSQYGSWDSNDGDSKFQRVRNKHISKFEGR